MSENIQVHKEHYAFGRYMTKRRWTSVWHQLHEVMQFQPERVLEIGPGAGVFKEVAKLFDVTVETLDVDPDLKPDHVASATSLPFEDGSYGVVCAFQMLEHIPYEKSLAAFKEMVRVSSDGVVISLPDAKPVWRYVIHLPKFRTYDLLIPSPRMNLPVHEFDGEHYWELSKKGYSVDNVKAELSEYCELSHTYRVKEYPYHRFFVFKK
jgi:ubiquinone/menaquinone biosynthesis C-methylase UbiE